MMPATQKLFIIILGVYDGQKSDTPILSDMAKQNILR